MYGLLLVLLLLFSVQGKAAAQSDRRGVWQAGSSGTSQPNASRYEYNRQSQYNRAPHPYKGQRSKSAGLYTDKNDIMETVKSGGVPRKFLVHLPRLYDPRRPVPVVIALHGLGMSIDSMRGLTLFDVPADTNNFMVVYPQGLGGGWNAGGLKPSSQANDVLFISDLIAQLKSKYAVDSRSIYVCGISNGGQMAQRLACSEISRQFAAVGVVAITGFTSVCKACTARQPIPIVFFLGTEDSLVPWEDGVSKKLGAFGEKYGIGDLSLTPTIAKYADFMTAEQVIDFWVEHNSSGSPRHEAMPDRDSRDGCRVARDSYGGGDREVLVYKIEGGGHSWPGGLGFVAEEKLGRTTNDINASQLLWDFFRRHSR